MTNPAAESSLVLLPKKTGAVLLLSNENYVALRIRG